MSEIQDRETQSETEENLPSEIEEEDEEEMPEEMEPENVPPPLLSFHNKLDMLYVSILTFICSASHARMGKKRGQADSPGSHEASWVAFPSYFWVLGKILGL